MAQHEPAAQDQNDYSLLTARILRDDVDGILEIDRTGRIVFINPAAKTILGVTDEVLGHRYASAIMADSDCSNDDFHQMLLDAILDKTTLHQRVVSYLRADGTQFSLQVRSSFVMGPDGVTREGIAIQFSDVTKQTLLERKVHESATDFIILLAGVCIWVFLYAIWDSLGRPIHVNLMTDLLLVLSFFMFLAYKYFTVLNLKDLGLSTENLRHNLRVGLVVSVIGFALLCGVKFLMMQVSPGYFLAGRPFVDLSLYTWEEATYAISVVWQEFVARGIVHESLRRIIPGPFSETLALVMSSLFFGAIHVHAGLHYMIGAALLLGALGFVYIRQNSIWGTCVPHYLLGVSLVVLDF